MNIKPTCIVNGKDSDLYLSEVSVLFMIAKLGFPVLVTGNQLFNPVQCKKIGYIPDDMVPRYELSSTSALYSITNPYCFELVLNLDGHFEQGEYQRCLSIAKQQLWPLVYVTDLDNPDDYNLGWNLFQNLQFFDNSVSVSNLLDEKPFYVEDGFLHIGNLNLRNRWDLSNKMNLIKSFRLVNKKSLLPWRTFPQGVMSEVEQFINKNQIQD